MLFSFGALSCDRLNSSDGILSILRIEDLLDAVLSIDYYYWGVNNL